MEHIIPPKPVNIETDETARREWKKKARVARELQAAEVRKSCRTRMTMEVVREFENTDFGFHGVSTIVEEHTPYLTY